MTVTVQNYKADNCGRPKCGQLILYRHVEGDEPEFVANWGDGGPTMTVGPIPLEAGRYYGQVLSEFPYNTTDRYILAVATD